MSRLTLSRLSKSYADAQVIKGVDLSVEPGEFVVFVGPSGCGKSTLLRMIAGLDSVSSGDIVIDGVRVNDLAPVKRGIAMVFQSYALYPHMTVFENIAFPLRVERLKEDEIRKRVTEAARILQLEERLQRKPGTLSGGQRQRVAIGRAIVRAPRIFLFDEPLSNLDASLRADMRIELKRLHERLGATMIYVTHDQVEAMTMADKIVVLNGGEIEQVGAPLDLYHRPANLFVAGFIGNPRMNFLDAACVSGGAGHTVVESALLGMIKLPITVPAALVGQPVTIGLRPEHLRLGEGPCRVVLRPAVVERVGLHTIVHHLESESGPMFSALFEGDAEAAIGAPMTASFDPENVMLFDKTGISLGV
jgi:multiple sugar transport system ATP-binding protein